MGVVIASWINILRGSLSSNMRKCAPRPQVRGTSEDCKNANTGAAPQGVIIIFINFIFKNTYLIYDGYIKH